jgi:hypothetical protein
MPIIGLTCDNLNTIVTNPFSIVRPMEKKLRSLSNGSGNIPSFFPIRLAYRAPDGESSRDA